MRRLSIAIALSLSLFHQGALARAAPAGVWDDEPPRIAAAMEQGGVLMASGNPWAAAGAWCQAGEMGFSEGFFKAGEAMAASGMEKRAGDLLRAAAATGHEGAAAALEGMAVETDGADFSCEGLGEWPGVSAEWLAAGLPAARRAVAGIVSSLAPSYGIPPGFALAVALVESNLNSRAVSPRMAMGVMQLIPETQRSFMPGTDPFDVRNNVKGGLSLLRWLWKRYDGDAVLVLAAYNAGPWTGTAASPPTPRPAPTWGG